MAGLSKGADKATRVAVAAALGVGVVAGGGLLVADGPLGLADDGETTTGTTTQIDTPTTDVPVYDVDRDGRLDYAVLNDEVVAVPADPPDPPEESQTAEWLVFAGTVIAALIGAGGLVGVARLNRDSEDEVAELKRRIDLLESG